MLARSFSDNKDLFDSILNHSKLSLSDTDKNGITGICTEITEAINKDPQNLTEFYQDLAKYIALDIHDDKNIVRSSMLEGFIHEDRGLGKGFIAYRTFSEIIQNSPKDKIIKSYKKYFKSSKSASAFLGSAGNFFYMLPNITPRTDKKEIYDLLIDEFSSEDKLFDLSVAKNLKELYQSAIDVNSTKLKQYIETHYEDNQYK